MKAAPAALGGLLLGLVLGWWAKQQAEGDEERPTARRRRAGGPPPREEIKMVLVVNDELRMGKGKICAQCAHAAVGLVDSLRDTQPDLLRHWENCGTPKICLRAQSTVELRSLAAAARGLGLPVFVVHDAGRTQVAAGSRTVLAIGPAAKSQVDRVTGHLKLL